MKQKKPQRASAEQSTRQLIIDALIKTAYSDGIAKVTIQKVADEAGIAFGTVRYQFNQKEIDLTLEAIRHVVNSAYSYLDRWLYEKRASSKIDPVVHYAEGMWNWVELHPKEASLLCYFYYLNSTANRPKPDHDEILAHSILRIESLIHEGQGRKMYSESVDANLSAKTIHSLILGVALIVGTTGNKGYHTSLRRIGLEVIRGVLENRVVQPKSS